MDTTAIVNSVKILLSITDDTHDAFLNELTIKSIADIQTFCNDTFETKTGVVLPDGLVSVLKDWIIIQFRRKGAEGKQSEGLGDYNVTFIDFPQSLKQRMYSYRRMRVY